MYLPDMQRLSPTARVILGLLLHGPRTGYDVKRISDYSTKFFWSASYGQIYPELRRLERAGLVTAEEAPRGAVQRRVYALTPDGERAAREWLTSDDGLELEYRNEGLLRLFLGRVLSRDEVLANLRRMREQHEWALARLREIEPMAREGIEEGAIDYSYLALQFGIGLTSWVVEWCSDTEAKITEARRPRRRRAAGRRPPRR